MLSNLLMRAIALGICTIDEAKRYAKLYNIVI